MNAIECKDIRKRFGKYEVLDKFSFQVKENAIYGLIGVNGAGKTTLLKSLLGVLNIDAGDIYFWGKHNEEISKGKIGNMIEMSAFYNDMTAEQNLEYFRILYQIKEKDVCKRVLKQVGLENAGRKKFKDFSLGMKQRLGIALAIMNDPKIVILDEPLNGLDPMGIILIRELILNLNKNQNVTFLISSHNLPELFLVATDFGIINEGKLIMQLTHEQLQEKSKKSYLIQVKNTELLNALVARGEIEKPVFAECDKIVFPQNDKTDRDLEFLEAEGIEFGEKKEHELSLEEFFCLAVSGKLN